MCELRETIARVSRSEAPVLIRGESGTGKELVARTIHESSPRASGPFVPINVTAIPKELLESELFGHVKGAFTGAGAAKPGVFREADGGTLFLDEIGDMKLDLQAKLLRTLQEKTVRPIGGTAKKVDVRIVAATHRDLAGRVKEELFREDLLHRLNVLKVETPPLRERRDDIPLLAEHFLRITAIEEKCEKTPHLSERALRAIKGNPWPGNVRGLENAIRCGVVSGSDPIEIEDLELGLEGVAGAARLQKPAEIEREAVEAALAVTGGNISRASALLGISRATYYRLRDRWR
jgi:DNA-binding NtrC family response regulator